MTDTADIQTHANMATITINPADSTIPQDVAFYSERTVAQTVSAAGALGVGFLIANVPGLLTVAGAMATAYVGGRFGRNLDMRQRPDIGTVKMFERFGEKVVHRLGPKTGPRKVWRASEAEIDGYLENEQVGAYGLGFRHSLPVKAFYTYPRLLIAKLKDEFNNNWWTRYVYGQSGTTFHEGVASRRLERAGLITPNPRTQQHIEYAGQWLKEKGQTFG